MSGVKTIICVNAAVSSHNWIEETYTGYDSFLGTSVSAYKSGSNATLFVRVYNNFWVGNPYWSYRPVNVSAVKVLPDWDKNYSSTEVSVDNPIVVEPYQYRIFTITFTVPNTTLASNLVVHNYDIYVEHINGTSGVTELIDTWTESGSNLAIYSADQADCMAIIQKYAGLSPTFSYPEAQIYWSKAMLESNSAQTSYASGNFADAKVHYHAMDDFINQAFSTESIKGSNAADSVTIQANAAQIQSFGFLLLGFGVSLLGGGVIIYGLRSSKSK